MLAARLTAGNRYSIGETMSQHSKRPPIITIKMRPENWDDVDRLMMLTRAASRSDAMRRAVAAERERLEREQEEREAARLSAQAILERIGEAS
jgi:hypothetical protein